MVFIIWLTGSSTSTKEELVKALKSSIPDLCVLDRTTELKLLLDAAKGDNTLTYEEKMAELAYFMSSWDVPVCIDLPSSHIGVRQNLRKKVGNEKYLEVCTLDIRGEFVATHSIDPSIKEKNRITSASIDENLTSTADYVIDISGNQLDNAIELINKEIRKRWGKPLVIIMGVGRSGTSFLTRALHLCGVYLGKLDELSTDINPQHHNLRGTWESGTIMDVLYHLSTKNKISESLKRRLTDFVYELNKHPSLASGFKLPHPSKLNELLPYLPDKIIVVGIFRHPVNVLKSRLRTGWVSPESYAEHLAEWKMGNEAMLRAIDSHGGFLLNFDWPKTRLLMEIQYIAGRLGLVQTDVSSWYTEDLKHADSDIQTSKIDIPADVLELYQVMCDRAETNRSERPIVSFYGRKYLMEIVQSLLEDNAEITSNFSQVIMPHFEVISAMKPDSLAFKTFLKYRSAVKRNWFLRLLARSVKPLVVRFVR